MLPDAPARFRAILSYRERHTVCHPDLGTDGGQHVGVRVPRGGAMSIGEVLHDARYRSGLTISDVAERTGIVEETIWAIELDDFAKCGEDFYARGYISVIAAVVRVDSAPLLAEFDAAHARHDAAHVRHDAGEVTHPI